MRWPWNDGSISLRCRMCSGPSSVSTEFPPIKGWIGAACSRRLAAEGARVAVCDVNVEGARAVAGELDGEAFAMDVTDSPSVREALNGIEETLAPVDLLVNNAGTDQFGFFKDTDEALWQRIVDINLIGVMRTTSAVLP